jgi:type IV secretion system protein VirD4
MRLCRAILILAVLIIGYAIAVLTMKMPWAAGLLALVTLSLSARKKYTQYTAHGTARWADASDLEQAGMLAGKPGLILGRVYVPRPGFLRSLNKLFDGKVSALLACELFVRSMRKLQPQSDTALVQLSNAVHVMVVAPTGVGKGVSCVIPFLKSCPDSCVVIDPKGENYKITAEHRRQAFGHRIVRLDPFGVCGKGSDSFNPLDQIMADSNFVIDDARALANALVIRSGEEKDPHWTDSAELWIGAVATTVALYGEQSDRSLQTMRAILTNPSKMAAVIKLMCESNACGGMVARIGNQLTNYKDKELSGVMTTTNRFMNFLDTLAILENTKSSSFDPAELNKGRTTAYLVLPPEFMRSQSALLRMWIGAMLKAVVRGGLQEANKVHFVLDESASLGRMDVLDDAVDKYRGYGVRLQFYYQSLGQLKKCWGEGGDQTLLSNTSQICFGVNDPTTALYVSDRLGEATIVVDSGGTSGGGSAQSNSQDSNTSRGSSWNTNSNWAFQARKLLKPEEVANLPARTAITFTPGIPPLMTTLTRYYEEGSRGKTRWKRLRWLGEVWLASLLLLVLAVAAAVMMTQMQIPQTR